MLLIRKRAYARAGLVGNPSDGYHGKTISISVRNFHAEVVLYEWDDVELILSDEDQSRFRSVQDLARDVKLHGYYGGIRLVKATVKKFVEFCQTPIPLEIQPSLALAVETEELGIAAGLQDRVIQVYEGLVFMDFGRERLREQCGYHYGVYE